MISTDWLSRPRPDPSARLRLFCFPYAGGGDAIFRLWWQSLPDDVEVCAVRLPGRDARRATPPFSRLTPLVHALADALAGDLSRPYALYGHSAGARVAFELAREQRRRDLPAPALLAVSGRRAPHLPERDPLHALSTDQLVSRLRRFGGTPEAVLREPELMALFLPIMRADLAVNEAEPHLSEPPLSCPIAAFGGTHDERCSPDELAAWRDHTTGPSSHSLFPGGHFFVNTATRDFLASLSEALRQTASPPAAP
jgi:medium-chain acyl-[acyl-carrier-protein] hydrolase